MNPIAMRCEEGNRRTRRFERWVGCYLLAVSLLLLPACGGDGDGGAAKTLRGEFVPIVVSIGDITNDGNPDLVATDGTITRRSLSGAVPIYIPPEAGPVFAWSPDRKWVAFRAQKPRELYIVPADGGGPPVQVSGAAVGTASSIDGLTYKWAPDSSRLGFIGVGASGKQEVYTALPTGVATKIGGTIFPDISNVLAFEWAPDSSRIAFVAKHESPGGGHRDDEVYTNLPTGDGLVRVSPPPPVFPGGFVRKIGWAPNSSRLAYTKDQTADGSGDPDELYTVQPLGESHTKVSGTIMGGAPGVADFAWAPDSSRLVYRAEQEENDLFELYTVLPGGGSIVKISGPTTARRNVTEVYRWSPNSSRVAFLATVQSGPQELYTVQQSGAGNVKVSGAPVSGGYVRHFAWAPDGSRLAYSADEITQGVVELYTALPAGDQKIKLSGALVAGGSLGRDSYYAFPTRPEFLWAPDSVRIAYVADQETDGIFELHWAHADGTFRAKVSEELPADSDVYDFAWLESGRVVYSDGPIGGGANSFRLTAVPREADTILILAPLTVNFSGGQEFAVR